MAGRSKNLLRNPCAKDGLDYWEIRCSGGDGFACEEEPAGCKPVCDCTSVKDNLPCWATSHEPCEKFQLVYLLESGISDEKLDKKKPPITIRDCYCPRGDCGCEYKLCVRLLGDDKETELDKWDYNDTKEEGADWTKVKHVFKDYPSGVRYVEFTHGGQDTKNWAGHYGAKMTNSGVFVGKKRSNQKKRVIREASGKNLVKNPCGKSGMDGWEVTANGGDGFVVEDEPAGCKPVKEANPDAEEDSCWATSHGECEKKQLIDLSYSGLDAAFMDDKKPEIKISEWYGARSDAGMEYWLTVRLLDGDMQELDRKDFKDSKEASGEWFQVTESFKEYPEGVRFVEYTHGGRDNCSWAGHYGAKFTCSSVMIEVEGQSSSTSSSSSSSSSSSGD